MKKGDREKVQALTKQAIREWHELETDVPLTSYIAEWLLLNDMAFTVRCKDCRFIIDREDGTHGCYRHFVEDCKQDDFCSYGERKPE